MPSAPSTTGDVQLPAVPSMRPYEMPTSAVIVNALPAISMYPVACGSRDSGTWRREIQITATAIGALIRKISRQE